MSIVFVLECSLPFFMSICVSFCLPELFRPKSGEFFNFVPKGF